MPPITIGNTEFKRTSFTTDRDYQYDYPAGLKLKPGTPAHAKLRDMILERAYYSANTMSTRHSDWNKIDHTLTAYIPADEEERIVQDDDVRKPVSIVFPNSYTILETLLSYFVGAFLQDPIFKYEGVTGDDVIGGMLLEKTIDLQCHKNKVGLNLHTQARDAFAYGFGVSTPTWVSQYGSKTQKSILMPGEKVKIPNQLLFEGNALENIDPYLYLPDPSFPIHSPQAGEFNAWMSRTNYLVLMGKEQNDKSLFNVRYLKKLLGRKSAVYPSDASGRNLKSGMSDNDSNSHYSQTIDIIKMFIRIIPNEWGLGSSHYPEMWYFELAQDEVIIRATKANSDTDKFPVNVMAPDFDGYSMMPISRIEILYGMQHVLDFMFNSHVANVRKAINDVLIYDPYLVNSKDLQSQQSKAGGLVRLRRPAWGKGTKDVVTQLAVNDVTRGNVQDSTWLVQWMERISGADASMQGALRQGGPERLTGQEFQGTRAGGVTRLERVVKVMGMQGMQDIGEFFATHNKQLMSAPEWIKLNGDWQEVLLNEFGADGKNMIDRNRLKVSPEDVDINYRVKVRDGSIPGGSYAQTWQQLFQTIVSQPQLAQTFDVVRIFSHIARELGAKNVNDFVKRGGNINPQQISDEGVKKGVQAGNLIPI